MRAFGVDSMFDIKGVSTTILQQRSQRRARPLYLASTIDLVKQSVYHLDFHNQRKEPRWSGCCGKQSVTIQTELCISCNSLLRIREGVTEGLLASKFIDERK